MSYTSYFIFGVENLREWEVFSEMKAKDCRL